MDFNIQEHFRIYITDTIFVSVNDTVISTWIIGGVLLLFAIICRILLAFRFKPVPESKFQNFIEVLVDVINGQVVSVVGKRFSYLGSWFFGLFLFFFASNISGVFGLRPPTADLTMTFAMAATTVILVQFMGIRYNTKEYFKGFLQPVFLFLPLNLVGEVAKVIPLSIRLFGNILSGMVLMTLISYLLPNWLSVGFPGVLSIYFDVAVGLLQAFVFCILSLFFIAMNSPSAEQG